MTDTRQLPSSVRETRSIGLTVDTTHLLGKHDGRSSIVGSSNSGNSEDVSHSGEVTASTGNSFLFLVNDIGVVVVSGGDDRVRSDLQERLEGFIVFTVLHKPSRGLGTEWDSDNENKGGDKSGTELKSPRDISSVFYDNL